MRDGAVGAGVGGDVAGAQHMSGVLGSRLTMGCLVWLCHVRGSDGPPSWVRWTLTWTPQMH